MAAAEFPGVEDNTSGGLMEALSCVVCSEMYEKPSRTPLVLPCGHTFCRACLITLRKTGNIQCPSCRAAHNVQVEALKEDFSILNILPFCNDFMHGKCNKHGDDLRYQCCTCNLPLCSLCLYSGHPQGHNVKLAKAFVKDKKFELLENIQSIFKTFEEQEEDLKEGFYSFDVNVMNLFQSIADLQDKQVKLTDLRHETQKASNITSIHLCEKEVKSFQVMVDEASGINVSEEGKEEDNKGSGEESEEKEPKDVKVKDNKGSGEESEEKELKDVKIKDNKRSGDKSKEKDLEVKENEKSGDKKKKQKNRREKEHKDVGGKEVVAAEEGAESSQEQQSHMEETERTQQTIINVCGGRLLLHSVTSPPPPLGLPFQLPCEVFLDLSVGERYLGRVFIRLRCDRRRAQLFLVLCTGIFGQSFQNIIATRFGEDCLVFKSIPNQNVLNNLEWRGLPNPEPETEGLVAIVDFWRQGRNSAALAICTKAIPSNNCGAEPFGRVVEGLEVVVEALQHNPVTITHSGLVLPGFTPCH